MRRRAAAQIMVTKRKLVLVGNGMAGMRAIEELLKLEPDMYDITVFGSEPHGNYNRILLSPVLAAEKTVADIMLNTREWYAENGITLHAGDEVVRVDRARRRVIAKSGLEVPYDRLILATGSNPIVLPLPGKELAGVVSYRDISDVDRMIDASREFKHAVVIGGGLLGLEAAYGLQKRGMDVTVVHLVGTLMERQLDASAGALLKRSLEERGLKFVMPAQTAAILGERHRGAAEARAGDVRHHGVRQRAARQLQPHSAVARARGREDRRRHHAEHARVVCRERHHAARGRRGRAHRSRAPARRREERPRGALRSLDSRDGLEPDRAAAAGQGARRASSAIATSPTSIA